MTETTPPVTIDAGTKVTLGAVMTAAAVVIGAATSVAITLHNWSASDRIWKDRIERMVVELTHGNWSRADQQTWSDRLADRNPQLSVPPLPRQEIVRAVRQNDAD